MTKKTQDIHGIEFLNKVLKRDPDKIREMRQQLTNFMVLWGRCIAGEKTGLKPNKKAFITEFNTQQVKAGFPDRGFNWLEARYQEFGNCLHQLGFPHCPGLSPKKKNGVIRSFTPQAQLLAVVVHAALKPNSLIHITETHALACNALKAKKDES